MLEVLLEPLHMLLPDFAGPPTHALGEAKKPRQLTLLAYLQPGLERRPLAGEPRARSGGGEIRRGMTQGGSDAALEVGPRSRGHASHGRGQPVEPAQEVLWVSSEVGPAIGHQHVRTVQGRAHIALLRGGDRCAGVDEADQAFHGENLWRLGLPTSGPEVAL